MKRIILIIILSAGSDRYYYIRRGVLSAVVDRSPTDHSRARFSGQAEDEGERRIAFSVSGLVLSHVISNMDKNFLY